MKRIFLFSLMLMVATAIASPAAFANTQTDLSDGAADQNGDGKVTLSELRRHNRDTRGTN